MVKSKVMCRQHLLGEHFEIHKAVGSLRKNGKWARSLTANGYLEPQNFKSRHDNLAEEMVARGYSHDSPLDVKDIPNLIGKVDVKKSKRDLIIRCPICRDNYKEMEK